jgi:hypothetical protein
MPHRNGTGPNGQGARSGRGMGNCAGQGGTEAVRGLGRGGGRGRRQGRGRGWDYANQGNSWIENLQAAIEKLTERLDKINKE